MATERSARTARGSARRRGGAGSDSGSQSRGRGKGSSSREREGQARNNAGAGPDADPEAVARLICLRLLSAAPRTKAQLADALRRRGVPDDAAARVLERFAEVKLIDDEMFARAWVDSRHHGRGLAGRALGAELRQRGVAAGDIETALSQLDPEQELATARELVQRRLATTAGMPFPARMRRLTGVLARKGYSPGLAYRVVREAMEREAADGSGAAFDLANLAEPADDEVPAETWGA